MNHGSARDFNLSLLLGCGGLFIVLFIAAALLILVAINQDRQVARYPGSEVISSHSNYSGLPFEYRWDDSYLVDDNFTSVYNWYSKRFDMGAESRAISGCIYLDSQQEFLVKRFITVQVCQTGQGQRIYVTRMTNLRR